MINQHNAYLLVMNTFFSSDFHLNHANIAGKNTSNWPRGYRDFNSLQEMNETIIANVNNTVGQEDTLYFLGDFCFGNMNLTPMWRRRIICENIIWIKGNHDKQIEKYSSVFTATADVAKIVVEKKTIFLSHYKHAIWDGSHKGYWHLYGHSHASAEDWKIGKSMDVGIDNAYRLLGEYRPFSFEEIKRIMDNIDIDYVDHHKTRK